MLIKNLRFWVCIFVTVFCVAPTGWSQSPAPAQSEPTKTDAMMQVLLSDNTDPTLREQQALALLQDHNTFPALGEILMRDNNASAKIIICKAMASYLSPFKFGESQKQIAAFFAEPLLACLFSDNLELSQWASQAIAKCDNNIEKQLASVASNPQQPQARRIVAVDTLKLIPEKNAATTLCEILDDPDPVIMHLAAEALADMLGQEPDSINPASKNAYLETLCEMSDTEFLRRQLNLSQKIILDYRKRLAGQKEQTANWRQKYLTMLGAEFDRLGSDPEKLNFLTGYLNQETNGSLKAWASQKIVDWAAAASVQSGPIAPTLVQLLAQHIHDPDDRVRLLTAQALAKLADKAQSTAPELMSQLKLETIPKNQAALLDVLSLFDSQSGLADQAMILLKSPSPIAAAPAARALKNICASPAGQLTDDQIAQIANAIAATYPMWEKSTEVRQELIGAMKPIAAKEKYRPIAKNQFETILIAALDAPEEPLRTAAVRTLAELNQHQTLPLLLNQKKFLEDPSPAVRFAAIDAIRDYGSADYLPLLRQRLELEQNLDVAKAIRDVFLKILNALTLDDIRRWADTLDKSDNALTTLLHDQVIVAMWDKISKNPDSDVPLDAKTYTLEHLANIARRDRQFSDAVKWYETLIALDLPEDKKNTYRLELIQTAMNCDDQSGILDSAAAVIASITDPAALNAALLSIDKFCQALNLNDPAQSLCQARILATLITPTLPNLPTETGNIWLARSRQTALRLIDEQILMIKNSGSENPAVIAILPKLDPRLTDFPSQQSAELKIKTLDQFKKLLTPAPESTTPQTTTQPPQPETKSTTQSQPATQPQTPSENNQNTIAQPK